MRYMTLFGGENFEMKEIRYYISDDKTQQSSDPEEIREYEAKMDAVNRCKIADFEDENGYPAILFKTEKPGDARYLYKYYHAAFGNIADDYIGYAVNQYMDAAMYDNTMITLKLYFKKLQKQIDDKKSIIDKLTEICNKR